MIELFIGPMCAGKTYAAVTRALKAAGGDASLILALRPEVDTRPPLGEVRSRAGVSISCRHVPDLALEPDKPIIVVDEFQFFGLDDPERVRAWYRAGHKVFVAGLNADAEGNAWPPVAILASYADCRTFHLCGACSRCGAPSTHTHRRAKAAGKVAIGDVGDYDPVCYSCWETLRRAKA